MFSQTFPGEKLRDFIEALVTGDVESLEILLQDFVATTMSVYDVPKDETERSYHLFVLGLLVALYDQYDVRSNRESGQGRYDIMLIPKVPGLKAVIIEFKKVIKEDRLEGAANRALEQIVARNYARELASRGFASHFSYGIAFCGKKVVVKIAG